MDGTPHHARDAICAVQFFGGISPSTEIYYSYYLSFNLKLITNAKTQYDVV